MSVATCMLEYVEDDAQAAAGDVIQFCTVNDHIAVCAFKDWCERTFCLTAGRIVEVAAEGSYEPSSLFVNRDVQHNLIVFYLFTFLPL